MQRRVTGQWPRRLEPDIQPPRFAIPWLHIVLRIAGLEHDGPVALEVTAHVVRHLGRMGGHKLLVICKCFRRRHIGHGGLVVEARFVHMERSGHRENRLAMLDGNDAAG